MGWRAQPGSPLDAIQRVKQAAGLPVTNWFAGAGQLERWMAAGTLCYLESPGALLIFRRDRDFHHVYHVAAEAAALGAALGMLPDAGLSPAVFTAEIVGRPEDVPPIAAIYQEHGFARHTSLIRMARLAGAGDAALPEDSEVAFGRPADQPFIQEFLDSVLDRFRDRMPDTEELAEMLSQRQALVVRRGADVGGVLIFEATGLTSHLRYWYVNPNFRDQGIGARLIKTFFRLSCGGQRIVLWVVSDNTDAIDKYQHYGFRPESLVDWIMIDKGKGQR
jgi:ribosomal protein S18 acetylase RimI-like enzyme